MSPANLHMLVRSAQTRAIVLDGGLATQLEAQGHELQHPLWTGSLLDGGEAAIRAAHTAYFLAGADVAISSSYQASTRGLREHGAGGHGMAECEAQERVRRTVELAMEARDAVEARIAGEPGRGALLVAGSVGPYGAYLADGGEYTGVYAAAMSVEQLREFHRGRLEALVAARADLLAVETMPCVKEPEAVLEELADVCAAAGRDIGCWVTFTLAERARWTAVEPSVMLGEDGERSKTEEEETQTKPSPVVEVRLANGDRLSDAVRLLERNDRVIGIGFNCCPLSVVEEAIVALRALTRKLIVVYPNSGEHYDGVAKTWSGGGGREARLNELGQLALRWRAAGASLIGGCCRMGLQEISKIREVLDDNG